MKGKNFGRLALIGGVTCVAGAASANLVLNGSFESGNIGNNTYLAVGAGNPFITSWTVSGTSVDVVSGPTRWVAADGNQMIDLAGTPGPGAVSQMLTTVIGQAYTVRFALSQNDEGGSDSEKDVDFSFGGYSENLMGADQNSWFYFQRTIVATSTSTELRFGSDSTGSFGGMVDDVSVNAVPEPATLAVLGIGAAAALRRRRK